MARDRFLLARGLALLLPLLLLGGALAFQYIGKLYPCEMCWWQRYPHSIAIVLAALAFRAPTDMRRGLVRLAAVAIAVSGAIGVFHAGVEYHWWQGITACSSTVQGSGGTAAEILARIMRAPIVRCDVAQWTLFGVSLAGLNAVLSLGGAGVIVALMRNAKP